MKIILSSILLLFCVFAAYPQEQNWLDLTFSENIETPSVPKKAQRPLRDHMAEIGSKLKNIESDVRLIRNGEVVLVTVPASKLFLPNSTEIKTCDNTLLKSLSKLLDYPTTYKLVIAAHSDDTGEEEYRYDLTDERAMAIDLCLSELSKKDGENVAPYGLGSEMPIKDNLSVENRAENRRIEFYIIPGPELIERAKSGKMK